jgi:Ni/Co efflux regulator RcnB
LPSGQCATTFLNEQAKRLVFAFGGLWRHVLGFRVMKLTVTVIDIALLGLISAAGAPVLAQGFTPPRFEGLDQQKQAQEQNSLDAQQKRLQAERDRVVTPGPNGAPPANAAASALRQTQLQDQINRAEIHQQQERAATARDNAVTDFALPNRRISKASVLVVPDPVRYGLPSAPPGEYYARVDGRFVLVDASSELVVKVLDPQPTDPADDAPAKPRPTPQPPIPVAPPGH